PMAEIIDYYEKRAPDRFELPDTTPSKSPLSIAFQRFGDGAGLMEHAVSNLNVVHLFDERRAEILLCDMRANVVKLMKPYESMTRWHVLASAPHPVHAEVVDLDGDGVKDIVVACLGQFLPTDQPCGRVLWLRGDKNGGFSPITLLDNIGRV